MMLLPCVQWAAFEDAQGVYLISEYAAKVRSLANG